MSNRLSRIVRGGSVMFSRRGRSRPRSRQAPRLEALEARALLARLEIVSPGGFALFGEVNDKSDRNSGSFAPLESPKREHLTVEDHPEGPYSESGSIIALAELNGPGADSDRSADSLTLAFGASADASGDGDLFPYTSRSEAGTGPGNAGGTVEFRIVAEEGEKDGDPVDITVAASAIFAFTGDARGLFGNFRAGYSGTGGDETLLDLERSSNQGDLRADLSKATFRSAIGKTFTAHARAFSQSDNSDPEGTTSRFLNVSGGLYVLLKVVPPDPAPAPNPSPGPNPNPNPNPNPIPYGPTSYKVKDDTVHVPAQVARVLGQVADAFYAQRGKALVITDGSRTPEDQADRLMNLLGNDYSQANIMNVYRLYGRGRTIKELLKVALASPDPATARESLAGAIRQQAMRNPPQYVSPHLIPTAVDISSRDASGQRLNAQDVKALTRIVNAVGGKAGDELRRPGQIRLSDNAHLHLTLPPDLTVF